MKIHKKDTRIKSIINWKNAPSYKLAKILAEKLQTCILLPYIFNVRNTAHLINDLNEIPYDQNLKLASFVITNMHTNIPTNKLLTIIDKASESNNIKNSLRLDIIKLSKTIADQNSFQSSDKTHLQTESLALEHRPPPYFPNSIYNT